MLHRLLVVLALVACKGGNTPPPTGDDDDDDDDDTGTCEVDDDCRSLVEVCEAGECVLGDRDNALLEATPIALGDEERREGVIVPDGDVDYYAYESAGGEWVSVRTFGTGDDELDTVVKVYTPTGALHAVMDDYPAYPYAVSGTLETGEEVDYDTVLYAYLPFAGTWYLSVEDEALPPDDPAEGGRDFSYEVLVREAFGVDDPDAIDDPGGEITLSDGGTLFALGVVLETADDADWIAVSHPYDDEPLEVWTATGLDGSAAQPLVRIWDGAEVVAEKDDLGAEWVSWFEARAGTFLVQATDALGGGSDDHWFPLFFRTYDPGDEQAFFGTNTYEREVEPNDASSEALLLSEDLESGYRAWRLQGRIESAADDDWWTASAAYGETIDVRCWTDDFGSLADLEVELSIAGASFASGADPDAEGYYVEGVASPVDGPFQVRVGGEGLESGPDAWYRCAVFVQP